MWDLDNKESRVLKNWWFWTVVLEKTLESPLDSKEIKPIKKPVRKSVLNIHWKDWCWNWNSNTAATWCEELTHLKRPWCWDRLKAGAEGDNRGWDGWMASSTQWSWIWVSSGSWWWTGRPGMLQSMALQRFRDGWVTELNSARQRLLLGGEELGLLWSQVYVSLCKGTNTPSGPHFSVLICPRIFRTVV